MRSGASANSVPRELSPFSESCLILSYVPLQGGVLLGGLLSQDGALS